MAKHFVELAVGQRVVYQERTWVVSEAHAGSHVVLTSPTGSDTVVLKSEGELAALAHPYGLIVLTKYRPNEPFTFKTGLSLNEAMGRARAYVGSELFTTYVVEVIQETPGASS